MTNPKVAFVIVGWNNIDLLEDCLNSILQQSYKNTQIIYLDNDSSDDSVEYVRTNYPNAIVLTPGENTGFAKGNNIAIKEALNDPSVGYIALLNSDARLDKDWTSEIVEFAQQKPSGAFYQGTTLDYYDHNVIDSTHIYISRNGQGTQGNWRNYATQEIGPKKVFGVNAAACIISRKFIEAQPFNELFDQKLFMYLEDIDLAARSTILGWDNYLVASARAYHMGSVSSGKNPGFSLYMTFRNNSSVLAKNLPVSLLIKMLPKIIRGDLDTIRTLRSRNQKGAPLKVVKGRAVGILRLPLFLPSILKLRKHRNIDKDYLWKLMDSGN